MKTFKSRLLGIILFSIFLINCDNSNKNNQENDNKALDTITKDLDTSLQKQNSDISISEEEAYVRMEAFINNNLNKYADYGIVEEISATGGYYNSDNKLDYFYTVNFYPGGDYVFLANFYYDSESDEISELLLKDAPNEINGIFSNEVKKGVIYGNANVFYGFSPEIMASRLIDVKFTIQGQNIELDKSFKSDYERALNEIKTELGSY